MSGGHGKHHKGHELLEKILKDLSPEKLQEIDDKHIAAHDKAYKKISDKPGMKKSETLETFANYMIEYDKQRGRLNDAIIKDNADLKEFYISEAKSFLESYGEQKGVDIYKHVKKKGISEVLQAYHSHTSEHAKKVKHTNVVTKHVIDLDLKTKKLLRDALAEKNTLLNEAPDDAQTIQVHNIDKHVLGYTENLYAQKDYAAKKADDHGHGGHDDHHAAH